MQTGLYKSIVCVRALVGELARRGIDSAQLFRDSHVDPRSLDDVRARVPIEEWQALVRRTITLTQDPGLGLSIGGHVSEHMLHVVGQLAVTCGTLRQAMRAFERYRGLLSNACNFDLIEEGDLAYFVCAPLVADVEAPQFEPELILSLVYRVSRRFATRDSDDAKEVWLRHASPAHAARYEEVFRCPVRFGRPRNAILLSRHFLDQRQPYGDTRLYEVLREGAERMLAELAAPSLPDRVRTLLRHEVDLCRVDARRVAKLFRLHPRTFRRQLIQANAPWSSLLDETRCQIACDELCHGDVSIKEVSERLGFSEQSAFNRAFKRWTGKTPAQYSRMMLTRSREGAA